MVNTTTATGQTAHQVQTAAAAAAVISAAGGGSRKNQGGRDELVLGLGARLAAGSAAGTGNVRSRAAAHQGGANPNKQNDGETDDGADDNTWNKKWTNVL